MELFMERFKDAFWFVITALLTVIDPVKNVLVFLLIAFLFNIVMGIVADIHVNKASFRINKAFNAFAQLFFYGCCAVFFDFGPRLMGDAEIGETAVKWLTYIVIYFYATNIFKNATSVWPRNKAIKFIYELLSTEIFDRLKSMVGYRTNKKNIDFK